MLLPSSEPTNHPGPARFWYPNVDKYACDSWNIRMPPISSYELSCLDKCGVRKQSWIEYHAPENTPVGLQASPLEFTTQRRITRPRRGSTHERETDLKKVIAHRVQHFITLKITFDFLSFCSKHFEMVLTVPSHCTSEHQSPEWRLSSSYTSSRSTKHCKQWKIGLN